jgi:hypothetical protein
MGLFEHCLHRFSKENIELMAVVASRIWFRRSKYVFKEVFAHPDEVYTAAVKSFSEYKACRQVDQLVQQVLAGTVSSKANIVWRPPQTCFIKINWDIAINKQEGCIGFGFIAWDCMGQFLGARSLTHPLRVDVKIAETIAALGAV